MKCKSYRAKHLPDKTCYSKASAGGYLTLPPLFIVPSEHVGNVQEGRIFNLRTQHRQTHTLPQSCRIRGTSRPRLGNGKKWWKPSNGCSPAGSRAALAQEIRDRCARAPQSTRTVTRIRQDHRGDSTAGPMSRTRSLPGPQAATRCWGFVPPEEPAKALLAGKWEAAGHAVVLLRATHTESPSLWKLLCEPVWQTPSPLPSSVPSRPVNPDSLSWWTDSTSIRKPTSSRSPFMPYVGGAESPM